MRFFFWPEYFFMLVELCMVPLMEPMEPDGVHWSPKKPIGSKRAQWDPVLLIQFANGTHYDAHFFLCKVKPDLLAHT